MPLSPFLLLLGAAAASPSWPQGSDAQLHYLDNELSMFMHYSVCTYNNGCNTSIVQPHGANCGYQGKQQPYPASSFNPTALDTDQWAQTAVDMGAKQVCLTVHHVGGFALWPTNASNYSIKESPFGATGRDMVQEFVSSMRRHELEPCFYIILDWDCAEWHDSIQEYFEIQKNMLTELLTNYGPIPRLWWDGYNANLAGPGHNPGGFPALFTNLTAHVRSLQSQTIMIPGPDGCLVGGEGGGGDYPTWNFNEGPTNYGCQSMPAGPDTAHVSELIYAPHEQDHSILNPGDMWWWVKGHAWLSAAELFEHYLVSVGRGNTYILNMPPNTTGIIPEYLTNETKQLGQAVKASFSAGGVGEIARLENQIVSCGKDAPGLVLTLPSGKGFDAVVLEEDLRKGNQRIASYELQIQGQTLRGYPQLGLTVGRKVIERGLNGSNVVQGGSLLFRCISASNASGDTGNTTAYLRSFSAHKMQPPPGWEQPKPPAPFNCSTFTPPCTCKGMADYYGIGPPPGRGGFGCAPQTAQDWWVKDKVPCIRSPMPNSCCQVSDFTKKHGPFPGCTQTFV